MKYFSLPYLFVAIQLLCLAVLALTGPLIADNLPGIFIEFSGIFLGLLAIYHMQPGNFNIIPVPKKGGKLVTTGIYSQLRHPMYLAQLLAFLPLVMASFTVFRMITWLVLLTDLLIKLHFEERGLIKHFAGYQDYKKRTKRIIPYIY